MMVIILLKKPGLYIMVKRRNVIFKRRPVLQKLKNL
jgi:hypothetical protein